MKIYNAGDINSMSWEEYGTALQRLSKKVQASGFTFDAIAPIMRSGAIPGSALAIHLRIAKIIPLQFKYLRQPTRLGIHAADTGSGPEAARSPHHFDLRK